MIKEENDTMMNKKIQKKSKSMDAKKWMKQMQLYKSKEESINKDAISKILSDLNLNEILKECESMVKKREKINYDIKKDVKKSYDLVNKVKELVYKL